MKQISVHHKTKSLDQNHVSTLQVIIHRRRVCLAERCHYHVSQWRVILPKGLICCHEDWHAITRSIMKRLMISKVDCNHCENEDLHIYENGFLQSLKLLQRIRKFFGVKEISCLRREMRNERFCDDDVTNLGCHVSVWNRDSLAHRVRIDHDRCPSAAIDNVIALRLRNHFVIARQWKEGIVRYRRWLWRLKLLRRREDEIMTTVDVKCQKTVPLDVIYDDRKQKGRVWLRDVILESFHRELVSQKDFLKFSLWVLASETVFFSII